MMTTMMLKLMHVFRDHSDGIYSAEVHSMKLF